jgi:hypothetical protein
MRLLFTLLVVSLVLACGPAFAQGSGLAGVTMRVVDDLSGIDAVMLELAPRDAEPADKTDAVEPPATDERDESRPQDEGAERPVPQPPA